MRKFAQNKTYWLPSACLVSETHIRWFASSITVSKLCSDIYGTPIPVVALPRSLNLHLIIIIEQAARIYFTLPIFRIVLLRYKFWKQNLRDVIKYVMLMINFTTLLNHLLLLWRFSYYLSGRRRAELESEHFWRAIPLKSCSLKARCSTKNLGEGRFRCRSKKITLTSSLVQTKKNCLHSSSMLAKKTKVVWTLNNHLKFNQKVNYFMSSLKDSMNNKRQSKFL